VLNAANEVAVAAFLEGALPFTGIPAVVESVLEAMPATTPGHFEDLFECDAEARRRATGDTVRIAASLDTVAGNGSVAR